MFKDIGMHTAKKKIKKREIENKDPVAVMKQAVAAL
jgi:hypothetical protein